MPGGRVVASGASFRSLYAPGLSEFKIGFLEMAGLEDRRTELVNSTVDNSSASLRRCGRLKNSGAIPG